MWLLRERLSGSPAKTISNTEAKHYRPLHWAPTGLYALNTQCVYTAISRKVVGKTVHSTILKGNMGYGQYTVLDTVAVESTFIAFLQHSQTYVHGFSCNSLKFLWKTVNSKSPTIPFGIVACTFSDNLSWNSSKRHNQDLASAEIIRHFIIRSLV